MNLKHRIQAHAELWSRYGQTFAHFWRHRAELGGGMLREDEAAFLPAALAVQEAPPSRTARLIARLLILLVACAFAWAVIGRMDIIVIGALRTRDVLELAQDAQKVGARGVLLAPVSYQKLSDDEVFGLFDAVTRSLSVPLCVYDNPATTHFEFSDELHGRIAQLPKVASIKIPGVPPDPGEARARVERLRALIPRHVTIGVSGDAFAATGLNAGCEAWYSVIAGLFPQVALAITRQAQAGNAQEATRLSERLAPLWALFSIRQPACHRHGCRASRTGFQPLSAPAGRVAARESAAAPRCHSR